jgi:urea transport system permease protein
MNLRRAVRASLLSIALCLGAPQVLAALDPAVVNQLGSESTDDKIAAIQRLSGSTDPLAAVLLGALADGDVYKLDDGKIIILKGDDAVDAASGAKVSPVPESKDQLVVNNRLRKVLETAQAGGKLASPERDVRLEAARELQTNATPAHLPKLREARAKETDPAIQAALEMAIAAASLKSDKLDERIAAIRTLGERGGASAKTLLNILTGGTQAAPPANEDEAKVRQEATAAIGAIDRRLRNVEMIGTALQGLSLASVLLLAALGLAITFGLMGIINMAHGELLMIGAYATYVVQSLFKQFLPGAFDWYVIAAIPAAFAASAIVGMLLETVVIRRLYGRPLETLLCTWGISLILMQTVRTIFGAQNVEVANPSWMSGGVSVIGGLVLPYNRISIVVFSAAVVLLVWLLLNYTRLGLFVRGVTQNRRMADCVGVPTRRIDTLTFGLGSGIAGLGGVALSQIGNVGPDLGQSYIVDSFMVVVLGGVGQLAGTVIAALGLGELNKLLEPFAGAVLGKIAILVLIILFIQKRPQGLFALKGRSAEVA